MRAVAVVLVIALTWFGSSRAYAAGGPDGGTVVCDETGCHVVVTHRGHAGNSGSSGNGGCTWAGHQVPCSMPGVGSFNAQDGCYYRVADPPPPTVDVRWRGHTPGAPGGAVYATFCPGLDPPYGFVWLANPPPGIAPTPAQLAQRAVASLTLPHPTIGMSPDVGLNDGQLATIVRVPTWFYTDASTWVTRTARASAGPVWAQVTVRPIALTFSPGDGAATVSCEGPGRAWVAGKDAEWAHAPGGCDYSYQRSTYGYSGDVLTATYGIEWRATWTGSDGTSGTVPVPPTTTTSTFAVAEAQAVVTR